MIRPILALLLLAAPAHAERAVFELSQEQVSITSTFSGTELTVYGAIRPDPGEAAPDTPPGVIVTIEGPEGVAIIRQKTREAGIWVNSDAAAYAPVPSFYDVATSAPLADLLRGSEDAAYNISVPARTRAVTARQPSGDPQAFAAAMTRIGERSGRFRSREGAVRLAQGALFDAHFSLPSSTSQGDYVVRVFLTRDGRVIDATRRVFAVRKAPLERYVYQFAQGNGTLYGCIAVLIAIATGWLASVIFRKDRR
ncbi:TIGR02186 family protein [Pseudooceanicola sp. CBS1P-1]|uniref:TIGR02186 family protein n=1 Tax=Pseudooceanicola albus TaxID=2692189 RepID=A0A6L7FYM8_9RHOB|nr:MULTISPECIES: TIGR02186 family protein [Pseudooceanicola]MBT9382303.1 TIGR02186 family protein [Pseudooceanicola endophyticus]MXN16845.1 hypothetical protein [Pseudooceanicola albus]